MNDRELLELAAKAAGYSIRFASDGTCFRTDKDWTGEWSPLTDDGDALRLAVKLKMDICRPHKDHDGVFVWVDHLSDFIEEKDEEDHYAATRRAIVRAAAEIGKAMP